MRVPVLVSSVALLLAPTVIAAQPPLRIALTIDDLPWSGPSPSAAERRDGSDRIIAALHAHRAPATAFVNCDNVRGDTALLRAWLDAGFALDNHTARHLDIDAVGAAAWLADARVCDGMLRSLGVVPRYLRFPMLRQGATLARRDSGARGLAALGVRTAHVTIDDSDYLIAEAYRRVRATGEEGSVAARAAIVALYVEHMLACTRHAEDVALRKLGRPVAHVLLLHASRLNADHLAAVLRALEKRGATFIALDEALRDPVYGRRDEYVGARGLSWLYRIAPLDPADGAWNARETARVVALLRRIEPPTVTGRGRLASARALHQ